MRLRSELALGQVIKPPSYRGTEAGQEAQYCVCGTEVSGWVGDTDQMAEVERDV